MSKYIVRTERGDIPVNPRGISMTDSDLRRRAEKVLRAAKSEGLKARLIHLRSNPAIPGVKEIRVSKEFAPLFQDAQGESTLGVPLTVLNSQRTIGGLDLARPTQDQTSIVIRGEGARDSAAAAALPLLTQGSSPNKTYITFPAADAADRLRSALRGKTGVVLGIMGDVAPTSSVPTFRWVEDVKAALASLSSSRAEAPPAAPIVFPVSAPRFEIPGEGAVMDTVDLATAEPEEVREFLNAQTAAVESEAAAIQQRLAEELSSRFGIEFFTVPYSPDNFRWMQDQPADVMVGFFYGRGPEGKRRHDPIERVMAELRPSPNLLTFYGDNYPPRKLFTGGGTVEDASSLALIVPPAPMRSPLFWRDVRDNLLPIVEKSAAETGRARGLKLRTVGASGAGFTAPVSGTIHKLVLKGVATPKVHIAREATGIFVEPYTKHIGEMALVLNERLAKAPTQRLPGGRVEVLEHLDPMIAKIRARIQEEKERINELNAMPLGATRDLEVLAQRVEGIQKRISLLSDRENLAFERFRRLKAEGDLMNAKYAREEVDLLRGVIAGLRDELRALPPTLARTAGLADRLRALRTLVPPKTPEGYYEGDDRTGVYLVEVYNLPPEQKPTVKVGTHVKVGDPVTEYAGAAQTFVAPITAVETALDAGKEGIAPSFVVVSAIHQRVPVTTADIYSVRSEPLPVPAPSGREFAYHALQDAIAGRPPSVDDADLVDAAQSVLKRMPRSGQGTKAYSDQIEVLIAEAADTYARVRQRRAFSASVNAYLAPVISPLLSKLEEVYRLEAAGGQRAMEEQYEALVYQYAGDQVRNLEARIEEAVAAGEGREWAERVAAEEATKASDRTGSPGEATEAMVVELMKKLAKKKYTPKLTTEPVFYYTLTFLDSKGNPLWMGSVPDMRVAPPEDVELLDKKGRQKYLPPIMSMYPLDPYRVAGMLRRSGGAMDMLFFMSRGSQMVWEDTNGRKSKDMSRAEFVQRSIERGVDLAAERRLLSGQAKRLVEGEVRIEFSPGEETGRGLSVKPYQIGGGAAGGSLQIGGTRRITLIGMVAGTEETAPGVESTSSSKRRFDRLVWQVKREYIGDDGRTNRDTFKTPLLNIINNIRSSLNERPLLELPKPPSAPTKSQRIEPTLITRATAGVQGTMADLERQAIEIKRRVYSAEPAQSEESILISQLGKMPRSNPMNRLLNNPRYRQLVAKTGRMFGKPVRYNGDPTDPLFEGLDFEDQPEIQPEVPTIRPRTEEVRPAQAEAARVRRAARAEAEEPVAQRPAAPSASAPRASSQDALVSERRSVAQRIDERLRTTKARWSEFYDLLKSPRASDDAIIAAKNEYEGSYDELTRLRAKLDALTIAILGEDLGKSEIEQRREDEAAMAAEVAASPAMRAPRGENEKFTVAVRSDLVEALAHDLRPDGLPYYNVDGMLRARDLPALELRSPEQQAARLASEGLYSRATGGPPLAPSRAALPMTLPLSPQQMMAAARSQGKLQRIRPASTASAFERAERARVGRSLSYTQYDAPDGVKLTRSGPGAKSIVLWLSPMGDHVIRFVNMARSGQFHKVAEDAETWVDVLAKALQHQALFLADEQMTATPQKWEIWVGRSGWPALYRVRASGEKKPFTVETAISRLREYGLGTDKEGEALEFLKQTPEKYAREVYQWTTNEQEMLEDARQYQNAVAQVFARATVAEREGLIRLKRAEEAQRLGERRETVRAEAAGAAPGVFVFVPPGVYDKEGAVRLENESSAGSYLFLALSRAVELARATGVPVRLLDASLFAGRDTLLQATLDPEQNDDLQLPTTPSGAPTEPKRDRFASPLIALLQLATAGSGPITLEIILPQSASMHEPRMAGLLDQFADADVSLRPVFTGARDAAAAFNAELGSHENQVVLINLPDEPFTMDVSEKERLQLFGRGELGREVMTAFAGNVGNLAGVIVTTTEDNRVENVRRGFRKAVSRYLSKALSQKTGTPEDAPVKSVDLDAIAAQIGLAPGSLAISEGKQMSGLTRKDIVDAVLVAMAQQHGMSNWEGLFQIINPLAPRSNPFVRKNYNRRTKIDMASRYMRQKPWMY